MFLKKAQMREHSWEIVVPAYTLRVGFTSFPWWAVGFSLSYCHGPYLVFDLGPWHGFLSLRRERSIE